MFYVSNVMGVKIFVCSRFLSLYLYVVFLTDHGPTAAVESPQTSTPQTTILENPPFYPYAPGSKGTSQHSNISKVLHSLPALEETLNQPHSQIISNIRSLTYSNPNHAVWSVDNNSHPFQVQFTAVNKRIQHRFLNRLYPIHNNKCNYWTTPDNRNEQFTIPCKQLQLPLPSNIRKCMMEHMSTQERFSLYLEHTGLRPKGSAWPPADALHHCVLYSLTSPSVLQAVTVANILKRNTILIIATNSHVWRPEIVYLPGDIEKSIIKNLLKSADNKNCIQNYLLSYNVGVPSTGGRNTVTSSYNEANTGSNCSVTYGLKTFTEKSAEVSWNEGKKENNLSDTSCIKSKDHTAKAGDITFENTTRYNKGNPGETIAAYIKKIQKNVANPYNEILEPSQIEVPVQNTTAHEIRVTGNGVRTYLTEVKQKINDSTYQKETMNKITTSYHNIQDQTAAIYHRKLQKAPTAVLKQDTVKITSSYQDKILVQNTTHQNNFRVERTTKDELYDTTITEFVTARNLPKITNDDLKDGPTITEFVTDRNLPKTTNDDLDDRTRNIEFVTDRNLPKTTYDDLDDGQIITEFVTARNLPKTTNDDLEDRTRNTEFVTARNLPKTTNDDLDDRTRNTEFVTAENLLQTVVYGMQVGKTKTTYASAWNMLKPTSSTSGDSTTNSGHVTPRDVLQRSTENWKGSTTKPEPVTTRDVMHTATANWSGITEDIQFDIRVTPFEQPSGDLIAGEEVPAYKGSTIQLAVTTNSPRFVTDIPTTGSLVTVGNTEPQFECTGCSVQSATQNVSDVMQVSSPVFKDTIATHPDNLAIQSLLVSTASSTEPTGNNAHDTITEENPNTKDVTHLDGSNQTMPVREQSFSNVNNASYVTLDKDGDIFGETTEHTQTLHTSTSADISEIVGQLVNSTISPAELLTLQILYELLLSKYDVAHVSDDMEAPGGTNTTHRVPQKGVSSEIRNTVKVLELIPGIMDDHILDNVTDEEINSLRGAVEYVWSVIENEEEMNINSSLVKTYQGADSTVNPSTPSLTLETDTNRSRRQTTEVVVGQQAEVHKSDGSPLGFIIRSVIYDKNWLQKKMSSLVTENVITDLSTKDTRNSQEEGNFVMEN